MMTLPSYDTESFNYTEQQVEASICKSSFAEFVKAFWTEVKGAGVLEWNWHMALVCEEMQLAMERVFRNEKRAYDLVLNIPPGTSKSTIVSILLPSWCWTRMRGMRFLSATHTDKLALDLSAKCRDVIISDKYKAYFPGIELIKDTESYFRNNFGGDRNTCTVGGKTPTGFHAHAVIVDDPIDPEGVRSDADLDKATRFITNVIPGRKTKKAVSVTIVVMQRLHWRDPTFVMEENARKPGAFPCRKICLPGELTSKVSPSLEEIRINHPDAYSNEHNLLDPGRLGLEVITDYKAKGALFYNAQILQDPEAPGGNMFEREWFSNKMVRTAPYEAVRVRVWDRACLVAGTMVETISGPKLIEEIVIGDMVLTRKGYKRVTWSGATKQTNDLLMIVFPDRLLVGTSDHLIWVKEKGWMSLASVYSNSYNNECVSVEEVKWQRSKKIPRLCGSTISNSQDVQERDTLTDTILKEGSPPPYTRPCGESIMERSLQVLTSIIQMGIMIISTLTVWNVLRGLSITSGIAYLPSGTKQRKQNFKETKRERKCGRGLSLPQESVLIAKRSFSPDTEIRKSQSSVLDCAGKGIGCKNEAELAVGAEESLSELPEPRLVPIAVRKWEVRQTVYDLTVEDEHEFFANGILVHNSTEDGGCYTAGVLMCMLTDRSKFFVEHCVHGQWAATKRNEIILATAQRDRLKYGPRYEPTIIIEGERGSTGEEAYQYLAAMLAGFHVREELPTGSKDSRAEPLASQIKAGNVYFVDGGKSTNTGEPDWDIENYVTEFVRFRPDPNVKRFGKYKDQVDATALAFISLVQGGPIKAEEILQVFTFRRDKKEKHIRLIVCDDAILKSLTIDDNETLLISLQDPLPVGSKKTPQNALTKLQETLVLNFLDLQPCERLEEWEKPVLPYGVLAEELIFSRDMGKRLWNFLFKKRNLPTGVVVIHGNGRKALSVAVSLADTLKIPRTVIYRPDHPETVVKEFLCPRCNQMSVSDHKYSSNDLGKKCSACTFEAHAGKVPKLETSPNQHVSELIRISRQWVVT